MARWNRQYYIFSPGEDAFVRWYGWLFQSVFSEEIDDNTGKSSIIINILPWLRSWLLLCWWHVVKTCPSSVVGDRVQLPWMFAFPNVPWVYIRGLRFDGLMLAKIIERLRDVWWRLWSIQQGYSYLPVAHAPRLYLSSAINMVLLESNMERYCILYS